MKKSCLIFSVLILLSQIAIAHTVNYNLANAAQGEIGFTYLWMGYTHIIPLGFDHILFILGLFLLNPKVKILITQATTFTVAHSITLALSMFNIIQPDLKIIEVIIALSILFIAFENLLIQDVKWWRYVIVFLFGLIHGCGFASALSEVGLPPHDRILALLTFNIGVECGQIAIIITAYFLIAKQFQLYPWYRRFIVIPMSICIGLVSLYWVVERM